MNEDKRIDLLKDEYIMLQNFYEDIDSKGLTIKNWAITVALPVIGTIRDWSGGSISASTPWHMPSSWRSSSGASSGP